MRLPEGWRRLSPTAGVKAIALLAMLVGLYAGSQAGYQAFLGAQKSHKAWQAQHTRMNAGWQRLLSLRESLDMAWQASSSVKSLPFSPIFFQRADARLVNWWPSGAGGEMALETSWQLVPSTFSLLAERDMQVVNFALTPENGVLRLTLQLVRDDEH